MVQSAPLLHIGCASGFSGDRSDGAAPIVAELIRRGGGVLIFETLAERTLALAQLAMNDDPQRGYEPLLVDLLEPVLADCLAHGIPIVSNFGAANPSGAARRISQLAQTLRVRTPRIAVVSGDALRGDDAMQALQRCTPDIDLSALDVVSATAYIGAAEIAEALRAGADIVVCGRVADPSLTLGPALAHFDWALDDWPRLARATMAGHMLECGTQVTGGYYAIPGLKDVSGLDHTGFPIVTLDADGHIELTKAPGTGGRVDRAIAVEQLLYEVHDPGAYLTPDVVADISHAQVVQMEGDRIAVRNVHGHARPATLKVNICYRGGWFAEAEISYAGIAAHARAQLAADIVRSRLGDALTLRVDFIGVQSILSDDEGAFQPDGHAHDPYAFGDVRLRVAATHPERQVAERVLREVTALYCCGPAGGGGVRTSIRQRLNMVSTLVPREQVTPSWRFWEES